MSFRDPLFFEKLFRIRSVFEISFRRWFRHPDLARSRPVNTFGVYKKECRGRGDYPEKLESIFFLLRRPSMLTRCALPWMLFRDAWTFFSRSRCAGQIPRKVGSRPAYGGQPSEQSEPSNPARIPCTLR